MTVPLSRESQDVLVIEVQNTSNKQAQNIKAEFVEKIIRETERVKTDLIL